MIATGITTPCRDKHVPTTRSPNRDTNRDMMSR